MRCILNDYIYSLSKIYLKILSITKSVGGFIVNNYILFPFYSRTLGPKVLFRKDFDTSFGSLNVKSINGDVSS